MRAYIFVFLFLVLGLAACQTGDDEQDGVKPGFVAVSSQVSAVSLLELALRPESYEGAYVRTEGSYSRLPRLFCSDDPHPSPATWQMSTDSLSVSAAGYDSQLRALIPEGTSIAVAGRWRKWQGPVGCGRRAAQQTIWYLEVDRIVSPSPLVQATLVPSESDGLPIAAKPTPNETLTASGLATPVPEITPTNTPGSGGPTHTLTPTVTRLSGSETPTTASQGVALTPQATSTATMELSVTRTGTPGATSTPTSTLDPNQTPAPTGSPTPTTASGNPPPPTSTPMTVATQPPLSTATPTDNYTLVDQGTFEPEELVTGILNPNEQHSWGFAIGPSELITVSVAAAPSVDIVLSITDDAGNQMWEQNRSPASAIEQLNRMPLDQAGDYQVRIHAAGGGTGSYVIMMLHKNSYDFASQDILTYGNERTVALEEESDHFWYFYGSADDVVTIAADPNDNGDLFLEVYGTDGANLGDFIDEGAGGERESIDLVLPDSGMYSIRVGEYEFLPSNYTIKLEG